MNTRTLILSLPFLLLSASPAFAQTTLYPYRRSRTSRIIGAVVGCVTLFLCLCLILLWSRKRRRARMAYGSHNIGMVGGQGLYNQNQGPYGNAHATGAGYGAKKPLFGGGGINWFAKNHNRNTSTSHPFVPQQQQGGYQPGYYGGQQQGYQGYDAQQSYAPPAGPPPGIGDDAGLAHPPPAYSGINKVPAPATPNQAEQGYVGGFRP